MKKILSAAIFVGVVFLGHQVSALTNASWMTSTTNTTNAQQVVVSGSYAYVADGQAGLKIFDLSNKAQPTLLATYDTPGTAEDVDVGSGNAYIADGTNGLVVVNISDPAHPTLVKTIDLPGQAHGVKWGNSLVYVAAGAAGFQQISNVDPNNPYLLSDFDTDGDARDVWGNLITIIVADGSNGLVVLTNSNHNILAGEPATYVNRYITAGPATHITVGAIIYNSNPFVFVSEGIAGVETYSGAFDGNLVKTATYDTAGSAGQTWLNTATDIYHPSYLYIADGTEGIKELALYNANTQWLVASFPLDSSSLGISAVSDNSYAYVANGTDGLSTVALAPLDPIAPTITLLGSNPVSLTVGARYTDPGFTAIDNVDGDRHNWTTVTPPSNFSGVASASTISGSFSTAGTFSITFTVSDNAGNSTTVQRTISVSPAVAETTVNPVIPTTGMQKATTILITSGNISKTVTPISNYYGAYSVTKINFGTKIYTIAVPRSKILGTKGVFIYGPGNVRILAASVDADFMRSGMTFKQFLSADKRTSFVVVAPRAASTKIRLFKLTSSGAVTLPTIKVANTKSLLTFAYLKLYRNGNGLVTAVRNNPTTFRVWKYNSTTQAFVRDTTFKISKLKFLSNGTIVLK